MSKIEEALKRADKLRNSGDEKKNRRFAQPVKLKRLTLIYIILAICLIIAGAFLMGGYLLFSAIIVAAAGTYLMLTRYLPLHKKIDKDIDLTDVYADVEMASEMISQINTESEASAMGNTAYKESGNSAAAKEAALSSEWVTVDSKGTRSFNAESSNESKHDNKRETTTSESDKWVRNR